MSETYLVTGGTGFLGSAMVRGLVESGHSVRVFDNGLRGHPRRLGDVAGEVELIEADVRDPDAMLSASKSVDAVLHFAFVNGTRYFYENPDLVLDVGVRGMLNVIDACLANDVPQLFIASSSEVYQSPPRIPTDEAVPLVIPDVHNPRYSYAAGKILSEAVALNFGRKHIDRVVVFRPHNIYGPDMGWEHVIPELALKLLDLIDNHESDPLPLPIQGDGSQTRAFMFVDDFVQALLLLVEKAEHLGVYHVGNPEEISIADAADTIARHLSHSVRLLASEAPAGGTLRRCPDITKLRKLGFEPAVSFTQGIGPTVDWYSAHRQLRLSPS